MATTPIKRALISVSDKTGVVELASELTAAGVEIISTGGTAALLKENNIACRDVAELTQSPEMMDGRVKTLHPKIHGGLLAKRDEPSHLEAMATHNIAAIDLLIVNLYPFEQVLESGGDAATHIENIDIGGPAMIRGAAKNHGDVAVVVEAVDYPQVLEAIKNGGTDLSFRQYLAQKAFARVAAYDAAISNWMAGEFASVPAAPDWFALGGRKKQSLRYGENPHQQAGFYATAPRVFGLASATQHQGKELSYNNINDANAAFALISEFKEEKAAVAIIKHANPCGVAVGTNLADSLAETYERALACDTSSAFGGIIATNKILDEAAAEAMSAIFTEIIIAPDASDAAKKIIAAKKNLRLLTSGGLYDTKNINAKQVKTIIGGLLCQSPDTAAITQAELKCVSKRQPSEQELEDLLFAWRVAKHVKSNAIIYAKAGATIGIGAGQMSRIDSSRLAAAKAAATENKSIKEFVAASDAFFPFADGLEALADAGAAAVIQPGGSMRDEEVIAAADARGLAMVFTGVRHFLH